MAHKRAFLLRMSPDLWDEIRRWAKDDLRSVNDRIEYVLREALRRRRKAGDPPPGPEGGDGFSVPGGRGQ